MSVMVVLLEFVRWEIGNKKGPENEGLVRSLHAFSGRASGQPNPSLEAGPRIRALALEYVMTFTMGYSSLCLRPIHLSSGLKKYALRGTCGEVCSRSESDLTTRSISAQRRFDHLPATSGFPRSTDINRPARLVRFVPKHKVAALQPAAREQEPRGR